MQSVRRALHRGLPLLAVAWLGCTQDKAEKTPTAETAAPATADKAAPAADPTTAPIELPPGDGPVAAVNGQDIARDKFNREYKQTLERYQKARHDVQPALRERLKDNIVRRLVDAELIRQQAEKMQVVIPPAELDQKWEEHKKRYGSEEAFKAFLERAGTSAEDVREQFESNLLREKVFAKVSEDVTVDPAEVKKFYDENPARYDEPEQVKASHILLRVQPVATAEEKAAKEKKAKEILAKAKKGDFEALAKEFGEDPTKDRGGDLGYFTKGRMVKAFEDAVWKMKVGQVSDLVETQFGFHIIKKTDHKKARKKPFAEVKDSIERSLAARQRNQAIRDALAKWKEEAKIDIHLKGDPAIINAGQAKPLLGRPQIQPTQGDKAQNPTLKLNPGQAKPETGDAPAH